MSAERADFLVSILDRVTRRLTFQGKIRLLPKVAAGAMLAILLLTVISGLVNRGSALRIRNGYYPAVQLSRELREGLDAMQRRMQDAAISQELEPLDDADAIRDTLLAAIDSAAGNPVLDAREIDRLRESILDYHGLARRSTERLIAGEMGDSMVTALQEMTSRYRSLSTQFERRILLYEGEIDRAFRSADALMSGNSALVAAVAILCVAFLWTLSSFTARLLTTSLTDPLREAARVANALAEGDVDIPMPAATDGEVGQLLRSMEQMVAYLKDMARVAESIAAGDLSARVDPRSERDSFGRAFHAMMQYLHEMSAVAESVSQGDLSRTVVPRSSRDNFGRAFEIMIRTLSAAIRDIREAADVISSASVQVAGSSQELSQSTSEEASTVAEANASVGRISALVTRNADDSRTMEQMAVQGAQDAEESGAAMREMLGGMERIASQISVIEQIATQTHLLALNASIEAARAGDFGRGFNVVANEVGTLAANSKAAAREITQLVAASHEAALRSGALLSSLVPSIGKTASLVEQVATASEEQATDLSLVSHAMSGVENATQRNAAAAQQLAATASELASQAESLQRALKRFRVAPADPAAAPTNGGVTLPDIRLPGLSVATAIPAADGGARRRRPSTIS